MVSEELYKTFKLGNTKLKKSMGDFDFEEPPIDPKMLSHTMYAFMLNHGAVGLAANQLELEHNVFVMDGGFACFNPKIIWYGNEHCILTEYCLSYPGLPVKVKRPSAIFVTYQMSDGTKIAREFEGLHARIFQHEFDHLRGKVHMDRATNREQIKALRRQLH